MFSIFTDNRLLITAIFNNKYLDAAIFNDKYFVGKRSVPSDKPSDLSDKPSQHHAEQEHNNNHKSINNKTIITMGKTITIVILALVATLSLVALNHVTNRLDAARNYIIALETDYPDFIDTTSGRDEYSEWYR